jgi:hypothetical protein
MTSDSTLATRFARNTHVYRSESPLGEEQMRGVAPSIFATGKHQSRSERYAYIPTAGANARGREHRSRCQPEPGAVDAGGGDEEAQALAT